MACLMAASVLQDCTSRCQLNLSVFSNKYQWSHWHSHISLSSGSKNVNTLLTPSYFARFWKTEMGISSPSFITFSVRLDLGMRTTLNNVILVLNLWLWRTSPHLHERSRYSVSFLWFSTCEILEIIHCKPRFHCKLIALNLAEEFCCT